jgi:hypothetical protein
MNPIEDYYLRKDEPAQSCLLALRACILAQAPAGEISEAWRYSMPFFLYRGHRFCYLWTRKGSGQPYVGFVNGDHVDDPDLLVEDRKRMKIFLVDPAKDLPIAQLQGLLRQAIEGLKVI